MAYIGHSASGNFTTKPSKDTFSGDGSTTAFTLSEGATTNTVDVFVENVRQEPTTAYTVDGTTLTFTAAPGSGTNNIYVVNRGPLQLSATHPAAQALEASTGTFTGDLTVDTSTLKVDSTNNRVGVGITSPEALTHIAGATADADGALGSQSPQLIIEGGNNNNPFEIGMDNSGATAVGFLQSRNKLSGVQFLSLNPKGGNVGIGTATPTQKLEVAGAGARIYLTGANEDIDMDATSNGQLQLDGVGYAGAIALNDVGMQIYHNSSGRALIFGTNETERMRISSSGNLLVGGTTYTGAGLSLAKPDGSGSFSIFSGAGTGFHWRFGNVTNGVVGSILSSTTSTTFSTSSDYRLKENVADITDGIERVKQLNPSRFNFIADPDTTVDGFLAHEVSDIVPEAITGEKDAMRDEEYEVTPAVLDDDGNVVTEAVMGTRSVPDYQGIDQAKLVPLLTAALQEAIAKIETLETQNADFEKRLTALEAE